MCSSSPLLLLLNSLNFATLYLHQRKCGVEGQRAAFAAGAVQQKVTLCSKQTHSRFDPFTINTLSITLAPHFTEKCKDMAQIFACSAGA